MAESLRDQLRALGLVKAPEPKAPDRRDAPGGARPAARPGSKPAAAPAGRQDGKGRGRATGRPDATSGAGHDRGAARPPKGAREPDLAQAYAARAREERSEREKAEREAQERAREKRERRARIAELLEGKALNAADAEVARHFTHGAKIRRVYVTAAQLPALNRGELGVVQRDGRYLLVTRETALAAQAIQPEALVLLVDPNSPAEDDVPPDLIW